MTGSARPASAPRRRWWVALSISVASLVVSLLLVEVALRALGFPSRVLEFRPSGVPGYAFMKPDQDYMERGFYTHQPPHRVRINSLGLRGDEPDPQRRWTILALGDSFTFGAGVNFEDTFAYGLRRLDERLGGGVEVINAGYVGATIDHELLVFERQGLPLKPDVVILQFFANDVDDLLQRQERARVYQQIEFPLKSYLRRTAIYVLLLKLKLHGRRATVNPAGDGAAEGVQALAFREDEFYIQTPSERLRQGWDQYLDYLARLLARTREEGIRLLILVIPDEYQVARPQLFPAPQEILGAFAGQHRVPLVDPLPVFRQLAGAGGTLYLSHDGHLNARGHAVVADLLFDALVEHDIASAPAP